MLIIWLGQVNVKNITATYVVINKAKVLGEQMGVTNFVHKNVYVFCTKTEIQVKMNRHAVQDGNCYKTR